MRKIILHIVAVGLLTGCASQSAEPSHILAREFESQYRLGHMQTMKDAEYLGQKDGRAYLRIKSMSLTDSKKWTEQLVYVELSELDKTFREQLPAKEYKQP
jgi:hypothetical protein